MSKDTKKNISIRQLSETEEILLRLKTIDNDTSDNGADKFTSDGLINKDWIMCSYKLYLLTFIYHSYLLNIFH